MDKHDSISGERVQVFLSFGKQFRGVYWEGEKMKGRKKERKRSQEFQLDCLE